MANTAALPPPADELSEQTVLAAIFDDPSLLGIIRLEVHHFFGRPHQEIYGAMLALQHTTDGPTLAAVRDYLSDRGHLQRCGGANYIEKELWASTPAVLEPEHAADRIVEKYHARKLIEQCRALEVEAYASTDTSQLLDKASTALSELAISTIDSNSISVAEAYNLSAFALDESATLVSIESLPGWPSQGALECPNTGHGWGECLNKLMAYGLRAGEIVAIGAASAGAGKTAFLHQLLDGLALRNITGPAVLTPVLMLSELSAREITWRSVARWTGYDAHIFRAGASYPNQELTREAFDAAKWALRHSELAEGRKWFRVFSPPRPERIVSQISRGIAHWIRRIHSQYPVSTIVPVIAIDPIQRWQSTEQKDEISALNSLAKELRETTQAQGWITLVTSDTNKGSATGGGKERGKHSDIEDAIASFRGSYNLIHEASTVMCLRRPPKAEPRDLPPYPVEVVVAKSRWGGTRPPWPRYDWEAARHRFLPLDASEADLRAEAEQESHEHVRAETDEEWDTKILAAIAQHANLRSATAICEKVKGNRAKNFASVKRLTLAGKIKMETNGYAITR